MSNQPSAKSYDAVVIGAGHNGLVAAATLAKARLKVLVLESRGVIGGAAATEEIFPGFHANTGSSDAGLFLPQIVHELDLEKHGLRWLQGPALARVLQPDGRALTLWRDVKKSQEEISRFSKADADRYPAFLDRIYRMAEILRSLMALTPPAFPEIRPGELLPWLPVGLKIRRLGRQEMMDFLRILPMPATDFLDEWFESQPLKAALGAASVRGGLFGPRASGTAFMLLYWAVGAAPGEFRASRVPRGGLGKLAEALARSARENGAEICLDTPAAEILIEAGQATGVRLQNNQVIKTRLVLSSASPRHTFFGLVGAANLEVRFVREVRNIRYRGGMARVNLALRGLPGSIRDRYNLTGENNLDDLSGHILICPSLDDLERASDDAKYGRFSQHPILDIVFPTVLDSSLAPPGQHLACVDVQYAPYELKEGNWDEQRERLGDEVVRTLEAYAPGLQDLILQRQVLTPLDLERTFGLPEGSITHSEMGLDQLLFMRPVPGWGQYRTPIKNLFLCGAGAHPGGGVTGAPGFNAAKEAIKSHS